MSACWFCREPVTEPDASNEMAVARAATAFSSPPPPPAPAAAPRPAPAVVPGPPVVHEPPPPVTEPIPSAIVGHVHVPVEGAPARQVFPVTGRRVRWGRVVLIGLLFGVLLTAAALAYESLWIRYLPPDADDVALTRASYSDIGCAVAFPSDWQAQETKRRVTFLSGETAKDRSTRGFRVSETDVPYERVDDQIADLPDRLGSYTALETFSGSVDEKPATVHVFVADDLRFEQWWIDAGKRALRVDLWSRPADEDAPVLNRRLVESITLL
jgi:hypothetical protein